MQRPMARLRAKPMAYATSLFFISYPRTISVEGEKQSQSTLRPISLSSNTLHGNVLRREHFVLQREHAGRGLVDPAGERDRALQDRFELLLVLNARLRVFVLDDQVG